MKAFATLFLDHPRAVGESYAEHFEVATAVGAQLVAAGLACAVHAVVPALFPRTASRTILTLSERMQRRGPVNPEVLGADCYCI